MVDLAASEVSIQLNPKDNIAIARVDIAEGTDICLPDRSVLIINERIPAGHKFSLCNIAPGEQIYRYGYSIGIATSSITPGCWVHTHNLSVGEIQKDYQLTIVNPPLTHPSTLSFLGYPRSDGRAGTRNYIAVISTVNCSAHVCLQIARQFTPDRLREYHNVDGVIPIVHHSGCSYPPGSLSQLYLQRTLANITSHPNIG